VCLSLHLWTVERVAGRAWLVVCYVYACARALNRFHPNGRDPHAIRRPTDMTNRVLE